MLELVNGFILLYLTLLCALSAFVPYIIKPMLACLCSTSLAERNIWSKILKLKAEQKGISMKEEFAAYSRIQRKIVVLENELKECVQSRATKNIALKGTISLALQGFVGIMMLGSVVWFRHKPLVKFHADLTPFTALLSYPTSMSNAISAHMWVVISNYSIRSMLKNFTA